MNHALGPIIILQFLHHVFLNDGVSHSLQDINAQSVRVDCCRRGLAVEWGPVFVVTPTLRTEPVKHWFAGA